MPNNEHPILNLDVNAELSDTRMRDIDTAAIAVYYFVRLLMKKAEHIGKIPLHLKYQSSEDQPNEEAAALAAALAAGEAAGEAAGLGRGVGRGVRPRGGAEVGRIFSTQFSRYLPLEKEEISRGLQQLIDVKFLVFDGVFLIDEKMVKDNELSIKLSEAGKKGAKITNSRFFTKERPQPRPQGKAAALAAGEAAGLGRGVGRYDVDDVINNNSLPDSKTDSNLSSSVVESTIQKEGAKKNGSVVPPKKEEEKKEPPSSSPTAACTDNTHAEYRKQFLQDKKFLDELMLTTGIKRLHIDQWLNLFHLNLSAESDKQKPNYAEYKRHFRNWVFKQDYKNVPRGYVDPKKNTPTMDDMLREFDDE